MYFTAQAKSPQKPVDMQPAFTLIELLIVVTIIVITTAAIVPSFNGYLRNQNAKQGIEQLKSDLRNVQNKALTGALSDAVISGNPVTHWGVRFSANSGTYEYFVSTNTTCPNAATIPATQYQGNARLSSDLQVKIGAYGCIFFSIANGDITSNLAGNQVIAGYVGSNAAGDCRRILFNTNGLMYVSTSNVCT